VGVPPAVARVSRGTSGHLFASPWVSTFDWVTRDACPTTRWALLFVLALLALCSPSFAQDATSDALTREREEQTGTAITILFDNSGSMKENDKIRQAKAAFRSWLQTVPADYKFSLITFENNGRLNVPLGEHTRDLIAQRVAQLEPIASTPICAALRIAREQIEKRRRDVTPYERHVVLVFTDGQETVDPRGINGVRQDIAALRGQTVEVVGVGFHGEGDYMKGVATRFALANNEQELKQGLAKVDAEIGGADDLVVSAEDLNALKNFNAPPPKTLAAQTTEPLPHAPPESPKPPSGNGGLKPRWILFFIIVFLIGRRLVGHHLRKP
jgi:Mg-chelatase subunit ChlD